MTAFLIGFWDVMTGNPPLSFLWIAIMSFLASLAASLLFNYIFPSIKGRRSVIWGVILIIPWIVLFLLI